MTPQSHDMPITLLCTQRGTAPTPMSEWCHNRRPDGISHHQSGIQKWDYDRLKGWVNRRISTYRKFQSLGQNFWQFQCKHEVLTPRESYENRASSTSISDLLITTLPKMLIKVLRHFLGLVAPPICRSGPNPKSKFEKERDNQIQMNPSNRNNTTSMQDTIIYLKVRQQLRSAYVLVVEVITKVGLSFTSLPVSRNHKGQLKFSIRNSRVIQTSWGSKLPCDS
jgi:hypothetical protein